MKATATRRDQAEHCQKKNMHHSKVSKQQHVRTFQIAVKPPPASSSNNNGKHHTTLHNTSPPVQVLAKQLKERLSKAMLKLNTTPPTFTKPFIPTTANTMTTVPIVTPPPRLENLKLLRQYLFFVAQETGTSVNIKQSDRGSHKIEIALSQNKDNEENQDHCHAARLGARLIESHVHSYSQMSSVIRKNEAPIKELEKIGSELKDEPDAMVKMKEESAPTVSLPLTMSLKEEQATPHWATRRNTLSDRRRRPGRPPSKRIVEQLPSRRSQRHVMSYASIVKCICDTPDEELGSMVQCDDCQRWLHLDCLKMSEAALGETFRCPSCFVAMGGKQANKLVSSMTWRFAARRQSEQLAAETANSDSETSDFEDQSNNSIQNRRRLRNRLHKQSPLQMEPEQSHQLQLSITSPECMEEDNSSSSSPSEASTPEQTFYSTDPFDAMETKDDQPMVLDSDSFEFISRLVYLQSLDSGQKEVFTSNASDVFLCGDVNKSDPMVASTTGISRYPSDTLPSSMCSQLLKEYSFDSGPFWKTMR